jgi:hypothetical protein
MLCTKSNIWSPRNHWRQEVRNASEETRILNVSFVYIVREAGNKYRVVFCIAFLYYKICTHKDYRTLPVGSFLVSLLCLRSTLTILKTKVRLCYRSGSSQGLYGQQNLDYDDDNDDNDDNNNNNNNNNNNVFITHEFIKLDQSCGVLIVWGLLTSQRIESGLFPNFS